MSSAGSEEVLFSLSADPEGVLAAFDQILSSIEGVSSAIDSMSGGASLGDIESALSGIGGMADDAAGGLGNLADAERSAGEGAFSLSEGLSGLAEGIGGVIERASEMAGAFLEFEAIGEVIKTVQGFAGAMIGMNSQFQNLNVTLKNFVGVKQAADITSWVQSWAQNVPFTTAAVEQAVVAVTALGDNAEQVVPALATVAAQMGQDLPTATQAMTDAQNGLWRMMERDLHITKDALIPFGLDVKDGAQALKDSLIPAFEKFAATEFPTALSDKMHTFSGELAELNDKFQLLAMTAGQPLFDLFQQTAGDALQFLQDHQDTINNLATVVGQDLAQAFRDLGGAVQFAWPYLQDVWQIGSKLTTDIFPLLTGLVGGAAQIWRDWSGSVQTVVVPLDTMAGSAGKLSDGLSHIPDMLQQFTTRTQELAGPLTPVKQMLDGLGQDLQNIVQWFTPIPGKTQEVTEKVKEWVDTGDGMGKWVSVTKQVNEVTPGQDSPFVQWLQSIGDAFSAAFGDDSKHTKVQELAQALKDFVQAIGDLASKNGQLATQILLTLAGAVGAAAGKLADFFGVMQKNHSEVDTFRTALEGLELLVAGKLVYSLGTTLVGAGTAAWKGIKDVSAGVKDLAGKYYDWVTGADNAKEATQQDEDEVQKFTDQVQVLKQAIQQLNEQWDAWDEHLSTLPEQMTGANEALQQFAEGPVLQVKEALLQLQEQKDALGEDFVGTFQGQVVEADGALVTFSDSGIVDAETGLRNLEMQAQTTGTELSTVFVTEVRTAQTSLQTFATAGVGTAKTGLKDLQTQETTTGEFTSGAFATDVEAGTLALDGEAASARGAAGNMGDLALAEDGAAASAAGTAGAGGLSGAMGTLGGALSSVLGPLMLVIAAEQTLGPLMDNMAKNLTGNPNLPNIFEMNTFQLFATEFQALMNLINNMGPHDTTDGWKQAAETAKQEAAEMAQAALDAAAKMKQAEEEANQKYLADLYNAEHATKEVFAGIGNAATDGLNAVKNSIQSTFAGLPGEATLWGQNVTASFAQGMLNYAGQVDNAANNLMNRVHKYLGVESPTEEGPGQRLMEWGPNLVKEFARGMLTQTGLVGNAASQVMQQARLGLTGGAYTNGINNAASAGLANPAVLSILTQMLAAMQQGNRVAALGSAPIPATMGSTTMQFGDLNFNGMNMSNIQTIYSELNFLGGLAAEYAKRGAINP